MKQNDFLYRFLNDKFLNQQITNHQINKPARHRQDQARQAGQQINKYFIYGYKNSGNRLPQVQDT